MKTLIAVLHRVTWKQICTDGIDNDGDGDIDGEDVDCSQSGGPLPNDREKFCSDGVDNDGNGAVDDLNECERSCTDGTDNDGDGKIDLEDNDCQIGGPCPLCLGNIPSRQEPTDDDRNQNDGDITDVSDENGGDRNQNDGDITDVSDENGGDSFLPEAIAK